MSNALRRIPLVVEPATGEAFASYLDRLAAQLGVPRMTLLHRTGLLEREHFRSTFRGYGVLLDPRTVIRFCQATRLAPQQVLAMQLLRYDGTALDFTRALSDDELVPGYGARIGWAYLASSNYCPGCLEESDGAWQLAWKLPWSFVCLRHRCLLASMCPQCRGRSGLGRSGSEAMPAHLARVPRPGRCSRSDRAGPRGRSARTCDALLADAIPMTIVHARIFRAQRQILCALESGNAGPQQLGEYFADLRALCALMLYVADADDLGLDGPMLIAFRDHELQRRREFAPGDRGLAGRRGARFAGRFFIGVPESPLLMAAVAPRAVEILSHPGTAALSREVAWLARRLEHRAHGPLLVPSSFSVSRTLRRALEASPGSVAIPVGVGSEQRDDLGAEHVPELLWEDEFRRLRRFFPGVSIEKARLFCSMALVMSLRGGSWGRAAADLGVDQLAGAKIAYELSVRLERAGTDRRFARSLSQTMRKLAADSAPISYGLRRTVLGALDEIDAASWEAICGQAGVAAGGSSRRRAAAAWLWAELTLGSVRRAPAWQGRWGPTPRRAYERFRRSALPAARGGLLDFGRRLLFDRFPEANEQLDVACCQSCANDRNALSSERTLTGSATREGETWARSSRVFREPASDCTPTRRRSGSRRRETCSTPQTSFAADLERRG